jgi:hypothetical protein
MLQGYTPLPPTLMRYGSSERGRRALQLALNRHRAISGKPVRPVIETGLQTPLSGYYMVDDEKLQALPAETLVELQAKGFLAPAYMMLASLSQLAQLIARKNATLG